MYQWKQTHRERALGRIEKQHYVTRTVPKHPADIGRAGVFAANFEDVHSLRLRDEVTEGQSAQQIPDDDGDEG